MDGWLCWGRPWSSDHPTKFYSWTARKGTVSVPISNQSAQSFCSFTLGMFTSFLEGVWDAEGGGGKTGAERATLHGFEISTAFDLYTFLKQYHSTVTNSYHKALHQVDTRVSLFPTWDILGVSSSQVSKLCVPLSQSHTSHCNRLFGSAPYL